MSGKYIENWEQLREIEKRTLKSIKRISFTGLSEIKEIEFFDYKPKDVKNEA